MDAHKTVNCLLSFLLLVHLPYQLDSVSPCIYDSNPKGVIDLTNVGRVDGTPAWKSIIPEMIDGHVYSYNPCHSFTQSVCANVAGCQLFATDEKVAYSLGAQNTAQWKVTLGQELPSIVYISPEKRSLHVDLHCLSSGEPDRLEVHGHDTVTGLYTVTLSSKCACWDGCKGSSKPKRGWSGGAIFMILLLILIILYVVVFIVFNKFKRRATGIDILPHRTFWTSLFGYWLAGVTFVFRKITCKGSGYNTV